MKFNIMPMFSVPLFQTNLGQLNTITKTWLMNLEFPDTAVGHDNTDDHLDPTSRGMTILDKPQLKNLKNQIKQSLDFFIHEVLNVEDEVDFSITTSWVNRHRKNEFISKHGHSNSMLSGVYYIETNSNTAPILFEKPYLYTNLFHNTVQPNLKQVPKNQFNATVYTIRPVPGDLLIFPSWLEHTVPDQSSVDRFSLAFNCFAKGNIGESSNMKVNL
jgi:uncharacterized protein (TIGR02466 family)